MSFTSPKSAKSVSISASKSSSTPKSATSPRLPSAICATRLPRVPTSLECEWFDSRLRKSGRDGFLGAQTLSPRFLRVGTPGMKTVRNRELLMAVANDATTIPRDFKHVRRMRAVLTAELQR